MILGSDYIVELKNGSCFIIGHSLPSPWRAASWLYACLPVLTSLRFTGVSLSYSCIFNIFLYIFIYIVILMYYEHKHVYLRFPC